MRHDRNPTTEDLARLHSESHKRECVKLVRLLRQSLTDADDYACDLAFALATEGTRRACHAFEADINSLIMKLDYYCLAWSLEK